MTMSSHELHRRLASLQAREIIFSWSSDTKWGDGRERTYFVWHDHALRPYSVPEAHRLVLDLEEES